ncbi:glutamate--tRNA ligase [Dehalogenimonas etheniformans]|uniref:Glutamate--tRNA ligase n=1 Tax=Dehalogenimonas etheniformans TaxID=1536648 RepID=A0A2P5P7E2_9CHLR|nr:glutamate--tRNA ligase [Dehalogenimonas etheniformans]PPD58216.1 glutamate--tRNA ligase [Dehalogenimonas etheniformans]QNT75625.1 glutamate--tRNA ligase [Dehalogenimonas etheniformans]
MNDLARVRYAPSPTGYPHVGNIRTALFNWLFARHNAGSFIVRIEDTDQARYVPGAVEAILDGLRWLGMDWDEGPEKNGAYGPYFQSQRLDRYKAAAEKLIASGHAYRCYCSSERLEQMRAAQEAAKVPTGYDRHCRDRCELGPEGVTPVVRFRMPLEGRTFFHDIIRGEVAFENALLDDFVLLKSDGFPTYHLANIVDDHDMAITHVMRAEEWLSSTPKHIQLYKAMGYEPPLYAHLPMILGSDRSKLSKRHGAVSIIDYKNQGYLPETMVNFLALLGWSLDATTEIMDVKKIIENFSLERISKTAAIFNIEKLDWMNGSYIRSLSLDEFTDRARPFLEAGVPEAAAYDRDYVKNALALIQERVKKLGELRDQPELTRFFFYQHLEYHAVDLVGKGMTTATTRQALQSSQDRLEKLDEFDIENMENEMRPLAAELGLKPGQLFGCLRVAVTGQSVSPPLFQTMAVLGRERTLSRIHEAVQKTHELAE